MNDLIIDALVEIGNHKRIVQECEPHVAEPMELKKWMVVRTLKAFLLFQEEWGQMSNGNPPLTITDKAVGVHISTEQGFRINDGWEKRND